MGKLAEVVSAWLPALSAGLTTCAILILVGWFLGRSFRLAAPDRLLVAPALGLGVFLISGAVAGRLGYPFTWWAGGLTILAVVGGLAAVGSRARRPEEPAAKRDGDLPRPHRAALVVSVAAASLIVTAILLAAVPSPTAVAPGPDTIFHLGAARYLAQQPAADFLQAGDFVWTQPIIYPGGFQSLTACIAAWSSLPVEVAAHAAVLTMTACVLPFGVVALARSVTGSIPIAIWAGALAGVSYLVFPYSQLAAGVAWSNLTSLALMPHLLTLVLAASRRSTLGEAWPLLLLGGVVAVAMGASQPNGLFAAALLIIPMTIASRTRAVQVLGVVGAVGFLAVLLVLAPSKLAAYEVSGPRSLREGVLLALKADTFPLEARHLVLVPLALVGLAVLLRRRETAWVPIGWGLLALLWCSPAVVSADLVPHLLWPWWNSGFRVLAALAIPSAVAVAVGVVTVVDAVARVGHLRGAARRVLISGTGLLVLGAVLAGVPGKVDVIADGYRPARLQDRWVSPDELEALKELSSYVEPGMVVAANPFRGGQFMYVTSGIRMLFPTENSLQSSGPALLARSLNMVRSDPLTCAEVRRYRVGYVLTGGSAPQYEYAEDGDALYPGVDAVDVSAGFTQVAEAGEYTLYRVPACSPT
jgi:hypothetical protein